LAEKISHVNLTLIVSKDLATVRMLQTDRRTDKVQHLMLPYKPAYDNGMRE